MVILEALTVGIPVVTSDLGGMAELVEHDRTGLLFSTGDSNDLAEKLQSLINEPDQLKRLRSHITPPWSQEEMGAAVELLYREFVN